MENEDSSLTKFVDFYRTGYAAYCRLVYAFYGGGHGGAPAPGTAGTVPPAPDVPASPSGRDAWETAT
ncbi:hypothetical protein [Actinomadura rifamycini]|uniref:hypothetical protein n=1 Tax=Actinomadura rifamycini TaxID=31962 RepID=UPI000428EE1D|nr:hypothetical protein [Actinomadura rifamycini]